MDQYGDILGHGSLPRRENPASTVSFTIRAALTLASILVVYILLQRSWEFVSRWKELNYKLRERRRHGIPDTDKRPFNVAYAAVLLARKEQDRQAANRRFEQQLREQRAQQDSNRQQPRPSTFLPVTQPYTPNRVTFADPYNTNPTAATVYPNDRRQVVSILKKRALDDEDLAGADYKKSRVESVESPEQVPYPSTSKRQPTNDSDLFPDRKASDSTLEEDMDVDDQIIDLGTTNRGKKRDRTEGGDYEEEDKSRRSKRRNKRRSDVGVDPRGKKRDRDPESSDQSDDEREAKSRKKRGKKSQPPVEEEESMSASDVSMDDATPSKARRAGDEWESNGIWYKLGRDGQRLQKVLMRESHKKYSMPQDSMHPDRDGRIEICMWAWLTEDELKEAKARGLLSHQDSPKIEEDETPVTPQSPVQPQEKQTPPKTGKHLLWESTGPSVRSMQENPFSSSSNKSPVKIKPDSMLASPRRLLPAGLTDSTNGSLRQYRQYSKWEKQDLEAKAMMKVREASRKKQEDAAKEQAEKEKSKAALAIPTISLTKPVEDLSTKPISLASAPPLSSGNSSSNPEAPKSTSSPFALPSAGKAAFFAPSPEKSEAKPSIPAFSATPQPTSNLFAPKPADKPTLQGAGFPSSFPSSFPQTAPASTASTPLAPPSTDAAKQIPAFPSVAASAAPSQPSAFAPPAAPASAPPAPSTSAPKFSFSIPGKPVTDNGAAPTPTMFSNANKMNAPEAPKPATSGAPTNPQASSAAATPASAPAAASTQGSGLKFNFLPPTRPQSTSAAQGGFSSTASPATTTTTTTTAPKPTFMFNTKPVETPAATPSSFSLNKPTEPAATPSSPFSFAQKPAEPAAAAPPSAPAPSTFSFAPKPAEPGPTSAFSFAPKAAAQPATVTTPATTPATSTSAPAPASEGLKFKFGGPSPSPFGSSTTTSAFAAPTQDAAKTTTTPFGTPSNAFGQDATKTTTPFGTPSSAFGQDATKTTPFGNPAPTTNIFGAKTDAAKPSENPFGVKSDGTASGSTETKNTFGTGVSAFGSTGFKFGDTSNKTGDGKEKSVFGFGATPSAFGTPAPTSSSTPATEPAKTGMFGTSTTPQTSAFGGFGGENKTTFGGFGSQTPSNIFGSSSNTGSQ